MAPAGTVSSVEEEEEETNETMVNIVAGVALVAALVLLFFQYSIAKVWIDSDDNPRKGQLGQLFSSGS